jgi:hypothetical protein
MLFNTSCWRNRTPPPILHPATRCVSESRKTNIGQSDIIHTSMRLAVLFAILALLTLSFIPMMLAFPRPDWPAWMIVFTFLSPILMAAAFFLAAIRIYRREKRT